MSKPNYPVKDGSHLIKEAPLGLKRTFEWASRWGQEANGFPFDEELSGPDGMHFTIFVPEGVEREKVAEAVSILRSDRDATGFTVYSLPKSFFEEMGWSFS